ncbi:hypothetical protein WN944_006738 [Citrus x changshan-huyou]|uniref:Protein kinase domain-containing protein n=3 Tax=Citrus TaxID=2706 RepID=A0AAP0QU43_9ROSI
MTEELCERVVVIQDASRDVNSSAIGGILKNLSLKHGDSLKFLAVLHQVNNPMGYKIRLDSSSMVRTNQKIIEEHISRKKEEYQTNVEIEQISKLCQAENIEFEIEVRPGVSLKTVAVRVAKKFKATWIILDRHVKEKSYYLENLSCKISRMKRDNSMEHLRGHKAIAKNKLQVEKINQDDQVSYDEMIPGSPRRKDSAEKSQISHKPNSDDEQDDGVGEPPWHNNRNKSTSFPKASSSDQLLTISRVLTKEASSSGYTETKHSSPLEPNGEEDDTFSIDLNKENFTSSPDADLESQKQISKNIESWLATSPNEAFDNSICPVCQNRRPKIGWTRDFTCAELRAATDGFSGSKYLSEGGFGSVFKGEINGLMIAVKQHKDASSQGDREFKSEVQVLSKARHENVVMLLGSCSDGNKRLLVYEYVCNGSLDQHLSKHTRTPLSWEKRMKIALGAAKGLQYLHENNIIHRDMGPNNILVTHDFEPMLGDFGLAKTQHEDSDYSTETGVVGTLGYLAPEYVECGKLSTKTDVYSFGVVLLQLITGLKTNDKTLGEKGLVGWARPLLKERNYPDLIDPRIIDCYDVHQLFWMVQIAKKCLSKDPQKRLPMDTVVDALKSIMEGTATSNIRGFSPGSDYGSSTSYSDSSESPSQSEDTSLSVDTTSVSSMNVRYPPTPPIQTFRRHPPSPSLPARRSTSSVQRRGYVLYDEMII